MATKQELEARVAELEEQVADAVLAQSGTETAKALLQNAVKVVADRMRSAGGVPVPAKVLLELEAVVAAEMDEGE